MMSIEEMPEFVVSTEPLELRAAVREEKCRWIGEILTRHTYLKLTKREKGIVRAYKEKRSSVSS